MTVDMLKVLRCYKHGTCLLCSLTPNPSPIGRGAGEAPQSGVSGIWRESPKAQRTSPSLQQSKYEKLFALSASVRGEFWRSCDNEPALRELAGRHGLMPVAVLMKNIHHQERIDLPGERSLDWLYA